jgi:hypothetical protein
MSAILIEAPPADRGWLAVNDRLTRATEPAGAPFEDR